MYYSSTYQSPLGCILLAADDSAAVGLWFKDSGQHAPCLYAEAKPQETAVIARVKHWLDVYFAGAKPDFTPPLRLLGTPFRQRVWNLLRSIPYGTTITYRDIAALLAAEDGRAMSAQAVGGAVGKNPLSIIIPCHRVVGSDNSLVGYAGGLNRKLALLKLEGACREDFFVPKGASL